VLGWALRVNHGLYVGFPLQGKSSVRTCLIIRE
jgi:hypothetical protein